MQRPLGSLLIYKRLKGVLPLQLSRSLGRLLLQASFPQATPSVAVSKFFGAASEGHPCPDDHVVSGPPHDAG
jgi:hypothetical protein